MTLVSIASNAAAVLGLPRPATVAANADRTVRTLHALLNRAGRGLARKRNTWGGGWAVLEREHAFATVAGRADYELPADFGALIAETAWDRAASRPLSGPQSPRAWQRARAGFPAPSAPGRRYRIRRAGSAGASRRFFVQPTPAATGEELAFEYLSRDWVVDAAGTAFRPAFERDDDESLIDPDLLELDLVWRFKQAKGLGFAAELAEFEVERDRRMADDSGGPATIHLDAGPGRALSGDGPGRPPGAVGVPETGFGA